MMPVLIRSCIRNSSRKAPLGELEVEFLPGTSNIAFSPAFLSVIPLKVGINSSGVFRASAFGCHVL